jgi:hypothetical protein
VAEPAPGAPVEPGTATPEVVPMRPASPMEAITVSFRDEAEAGDVAPGAASPTVSDLLRAIPDTPEVAPNSGTWRAEEAGPSDTPGTVLGVGLLGNEIIIEPPLSGGSGDLIRTALDPSIWGGPTVAWMSTKGDPYFMLDDLEEWELWAEMRVVTQVRVLPPFILGILCPFAV